MCICIYEKERERVIEIDGMSVYFRGFRALGLRLQMNVDMCVH